MLTVEKPKNDITPIEKGGTGGTTPEEARTNLEISLAELGAFPANEVQTTEPDGLSLDTQVTSAARLFKMLGGALSTLKTTAKTLVGSINEITPIVSDTSFYIQTSIWTPNADGDFRAVYSQPFASLPSEEKYLFSVALSPGQGSAAKTAWEAGSIGIYSIESSGDFILSAWAQSSTMYFVDIVAQRIRA